jgi:hypothetical protein
VGFEFLTAVVMKSFIFWELCLPPAFMLLFWLAYAVTLMMEVTCSSEISVDFQWATCRYIPEDRTLRVYLIYFLVTDQMLLSLWHVSVIKLPSAGGHQIVKET